MPIGDLLASISGGPSASNAPPKRKAEDDLKPAPKIARKTPPLPRSTQPSRPLDRPNGNARPTNGNGVKPNPVALKPLNGANKVTKPVASSRPAAPASAPPAANRAPPKKGSYAEILARAQKAHSTMGQVGMIQHKKVEKKARDVATKPERPDPRAPVRKPTGPTRPSGYQGTSKVGQRPGANGLSRNGAQDRSKPLGKPSPADRKSAAAAQDEQEKKMKKAAQATTGYTGTARPRPGAATTKKDKAVPRGGALLNRAPSRPGNSKSSRYEDDYDEDLDDFIDYDDEEEQDVGGPRYDYDSEGSSDMEAGLDDIDIEERRAERQAKLDDLREERKLQMLKAEKEERKRQAELAARGR